MPKLMPSLTMALALLAASLVGGAEELVSPAQ